jgi:hypothetical protein
MPEIAEEIQQNLYWFPPQETVYLVMDNAGGHGTREAREAYTTQLLENYNIENYTTISMLTRVKCPRSGHLDEHSVSSRMHALRMMKRSRQFSIQCPRGMATLTRKYNFLGVQ